MIQYEKTITINRPIEAVFTYVSNLQNGAEWQGSLVEVHRKTDGPLGVGSRFSSVRKFMGRKVESEVEFIGYELNKKIVFKSISGPSPFEQSFVFEPVSGGTTLTALFKLETSGWMGLVEPLIASSIKREMEANFSELKVKLECQVEEAFQLLE
jgi:uncharacterized membrane protein